MGSMLGLGDHPSQYDNLTLMNRELWCARLGLFEGSFEWKQVSVTVDEKGFICIVLLFEDDRCKDQIGRDIIVDAKDGPQSSDTVDLSRGAKTYRAMCHKPWNRS